VGRETLLTGEQILTYIAERSPIDTTTVGDMKSKHVTESAQNLTSKLRGRGRIRAHSNAVAEGRKRKKENDPKKIKRFPRKIRERDIFPSFTSVTLQLPIMSTAAEIASAISEFDIFAHTPIQMSVLGTTEDTYKPIAPSIEMIWNFLHLPITTFISNNLLNCISKVNRYGPR